MDLGIQREQYCLRFESDGTRIVESSQNTDLTGWRAVIADGVIEAVSGFEFKSFSKPQDSDNLQLETTVDAYGEWVTVWERTGTIGQEYLVLADAQGYAPVFYTEDHSTQSVLLASSHQAILGQSPRRVNWGLASLHLASSHRVFQVASAEETIAEGVRILGVDKALLIRPDGTFLIARPSSKSSESYDYQALLQRGVERTIVQLQRVAAQFGSIQLNLSGGRDSRVVLALALAAGVKENIRVITKGPKPQHSQYQQRALGADLKIAGGLVERFGLEWFGGAPAIRHGVPLRQLFESYQSYSSGWNFNAVAANFLSLWTTTEVGLRGGAGELLRSSGLARTAEEWCRTDLDKHPEMGPQQADLILKRLGGLRSSPAWTEFADGSLVRASLLRWEGLPVRTAMDEYFRQFRQRAHFGHHGRFLGMANEMTLHPLGNSDFLSAAGLLSASDREQGLAVFDIIELAYPELNRLPFDDGHWPAGLADRSTTRLPFSPRELPEMRTSSFVSAQEKQIAAVPREIIQHEGFREDRSVPVPTQVSSYNEYLIREIRQGDKSSPETLHELVRGLPPTTKSQKEVMGKLGSIADVMGIHTRPSDLLVFSAKRTRSARLPWTVTTSRPMR